ncbi:MAG: 60S ribosomal export protein NMD3 [Thermoplasmatota archaeon]
MVCIVCGRGRPALRGVCAECLSKSGSYVKVPEFAELVLCAHCGSVLRGQRWVSSRGLARELEEAVVRALDVPRRDGASVETRARVSSLGERHADVEVEATVRVGRGGFRKRAVTRVRIRRAVCEGCSRMRGSYYEALLQVRAAGRELSPDELDLVRRRVAELMDSVRDSRDFVASADDVDGGLDFRLGRLARGRALARALASELGGVVTESSTIVGRRGGRDIHRVTFLLRLPALRAGDVARLEGRALLVTHVGPGGVSCLDLLSGEEMALEGREAEEAVRVGCIEEAEEAVVLDARRPEVTVLDPVSLRPLSIVAPGWFWEMGERGSARIVRVEGEAFLVPDRAGAGPPRPGPARARETLRGRKSASLSRRE